MRSFTIIIITIIIIKIKRLKRRLTLKSNQSNDDWYMNGFKHHPQVSRDDAIGLFHTAAGNGHTTHIQRLHFLQPNAIGFLFFKIGIKSTLLWYHLHIMLVLLDRDWGRGSKLTPKQKFSVTSVGFIFNQWGLNPQPPTNRTLLITLKTYYPISWAGKM